MSHNKLKLCPHCGEPARIRVDEFDNGKEYQTVECLGRDCGPYQGTFDDSILWWNNRPLEDALKKECDELREILEFHPRAAKLMKKKKGFIVIAIDETYFQTAYELIRNSEMKNNSWTADDEFHFWKMIKAASVLNGF